MGAEQHEGGQDMDKKMHRGGRWSAGLAVALAVGLTANVGAAKADVNVKGDVWVPLRTVAEAVGAKVRWDAKISTIVITKGETTLKLKPDSAVGEKNGREFALDEPVHVDNGRAYVPLQSLNEWLGTKAEWNLSSHRVVTGKIDQFQVQAVPNHSKAVYDLNLEMDEKGAFRVRAKMAVENLSPEVWKELAFYFIPHMYHEENPKPDVFDTTPQVAVQRVTVNGQTASFSLEKDDLRVQVPGGLAPGAKADVEVTYAMTLPIEGTRLYKTMEHYYLAQWYPMLCNYLNGWNKSPYVETAETYLTDHTDFTVTYKLPQGYSLFSTADQDAKPGVSSGTLKAERVKEFYIAIAKDSEMVTNSKKFGNVEVRVMARPKDEKMMNMALETAGKALTFFTEKIGSYPMKQFDIVLDMLKAGGMEYPGIVTARPNRDEESMKHAVVHEVAHQWFYGMVNNDPYYAGWLDEGLTELATTLYLASEEHDADQKMAFRFAAALMARVNKVPASNTSVGEIESKQQGAAYYAQPSMRLFDLFARYGDPVEEGTSFLRAYFATYRYKQVDTKEFVRFVKAYYPLDDDWFREWLKV
jgi:predicted Zn-dependent protease with MMP-like domain